tara:strand:- start:327 stop:950 length:624 start_codon:yes stop_codon:yes gene_type:complete
MDFEERYVKNVYNTISNKFSATRGYLWGGVEKFINSLEEESLILDAGCGNGKNMFRDDCHFIGIDNSIKMIEIVNSRSKIGMIGDVRKIPFKNDTFDAALSVAVIHHLYEDSDRIKAVNELVRVVKKGGKIFIQVWENMKNKSSKFEQIEKNDYLVKWDNRDGNIYKRYYHLFDRDEFIKLFHNIKNIKIINMNYELENWIIILQKI